MNVIVNRMMREALVVTAPGRVNLIGEHIDYHGLPVLPMALRRGIRVDFRARADRAIRATSEGYGTREFEWTADLEPVSAGDWENYLRAAARVAATFLPGTRAGVDAAIASDLPAAAGLSSSSALIVAFTLGLLRANGYNPSFEELMAVLPDGEQFVGTRGGGMDHAASLGSRAGCASLISFEPLSVRHVPIPPGWAFLIADSGVRAEKSGAAREEYNVRRAAGTAALARLGLRTYRDAAPEMAEWLDDSREHDAFQHVTTEAARVGAAVEALAQNDLPRFGRLLTESHVSLRDRLGVSCPELDRLVGMAMRNGAAGARLTGAGFGGCAVICCERSRVSMLRAAIPDAIEVEAGRGVGLTGPRASDALDRPGNLSGRNWSFD
jgi:galactokinase